MEREEEARAKVQLCCSTTSRRNQFLNIVKYGFTRFDRRGCKLQLDHLTVLLRIHVRSLENFQNLVLREKCIMGSSKRVWLGLFPSIFYNLFLHMTLQFSQVTNTHIHTHFSPSSPLSLHISLDSSLSPSLNSFVRHLPLPPTCRYCPSEIQVRQRGAKRI